MSRKNILLIIHRLPYPLNSGGNQAIFNSIKAIKDYYNIFVTYPDRNTASDQRDKSAFLSEMNDGVTLLPWIEEHTAPQRSLLQRSVGKLSSVLNKHSKLHSSPKNPYSWWIEELLPKPSKFTLHVKQIISDHDIKLVQCEMVRNLPFVLSLPDNVKKVFVHHELGFVRHQLELKSVSSDIYDGAAICQWAKLLEINLLNRFDRVVTLSAIDSQKLREAGVTTMIHDSFAIIKTTDAVSTNTSNPLELCFMGPDNHLPNYVGIKWFLDNCWPLLLKTNSDYHLRIIGKWTDANIADFTARYPNISFLGFVDDLRSAIQDTIMIVPITIGSGIRMKILEASNLGVPFVSTSVGAEGIPVISGKHCLIADDPSDFAKAIVQMNNEDLRTTFVRNAHQMVKDNYSLEALRRNRITLYSSLL